MRRNTEEKKHRGVTKGAGWFILKLIDCGGDSSIKTFEQFALSNTKPSYIYYHCPLNHMLFINAKWIQLFMSNRHCHSQVETFDVISEHEMNFYHCIISQSK